MFLYTNLTRKQHRNRLGVTTIGCTIYIYSLQFNLCVFKLHNSKVADRFLKTKFKETFYKFYKIPNRVATENL